MIYLVEADESTCTGLQRLLAAEDFEVMAFASVSAMLASCTLGDQDLVIIDTHHCSASPEDILAQLRQAEKGAAVIVLHLPQHAAGEEMLRGLAKNAGAVGFFSKPVDGFALLDAVRFATTDG